MREGSRESEGHQNYASVFSLLLDALRILFLFGVTTAEKLGT